MLLAALADHFEILDNLTSRNAMVDALSVLFRQICGSVELREVIYLAEGILLPPYEAAEIGISEQLMARAIAEATGKDISDVRALYLSLGDYGSVAEELVTWESKGLTVSEAYSALLELAGMSGKGSIGTKLSGLANLIRQMGPKEARYVVRVPLGRLRLGIGDPTIMDALSKAYDGDRHLRNVIENAYNLCSDMGQVGLILCADGHERLEKFEVRIGDPIRVALSERGASVQDILRRMGMCAVEPKYDGFRCQVHKDGDQVSIFTRNLENATAMFPDIVAATLKQIKAERAIFEGEAVSYDPNSSRFHSFQVTVQRKRTHLIEVKEEELPLRLMAFDCLYRDGEEILYKPYDERRKALAEMLQPDWKIEMTESLISDSADEVSAFFDKMIAAGMEGIMAKSLQSPYHAGRRTFDWIKLKRSHKDELRDTLDCVIVGYFVGRGKRASWGIGSLLCAVYNADQDRFETITKVATGLKDQEWKDMKATLDEIRVDDKPARVESVYKPYVWVEPKYVTEVIADEITRSPSHTAGRDGDKTGYALRFPRIITAIRADRMPEDATTVTEVRRLNEIEHNAGQNG